MATSYLLSYLNFFYSKQQILVSIWLEENMVYLWEKQFSVIIWWTNSKQQDIKDYKTIHCWNFKNSHSQETKMSTCQMKTFFDILKVSGRCNPRESVKQLYCLLEIIIQLNRSQNQLSYKNVFAQRIWILFCSWIVGYSIILCSLYSSD